MRRDSDALVLAIDSGLSAVKTALFRDDGTMVALREVPNTAVASQGARSEMNLDGLWAIVRSAVRGVLQDPGRPTGELLGVGLTGHGNGLYLVGPGGEPILGVTSMDRRALRTVEQWSRTDVAETILSGTGNHVWSGQPLALLRYLSEAGELPADFRLLFCKDWIRCRLTGELATDRCEASAAGLLDPKSGDWADEAFEAAGVGELRRRLPALVNSYEATGVIGKRAASETGLPEGLPVFAGSIDLALASMADGLAGEAELHVTAGTWSINQQCCESVQETAAFLQTIVSPGSPGFLRVDSSPTCAANLSVLSTLLGGEANYRTWEGLLGTRGLGPEDPIYLPYPSGAWDLPRATASLRQIRLGSSREQLVRAVYDGIALGQVRQIRKFQERSGLDKLILCGGLARSDGWCRLLCDYAGLPLEVSDNPHSSALGAALCAWRGLGAPGTEVRKEGRRHYAPRSGEVSLERYDRFRGYLNGEGRWI